MLVAIGAGIAVLTGIGAGIGIGMATSKAVEDVYKRQLCGCLLWLLCETFWVTGGMRMRL